MLSSNSAERSELKKTETEWDNVGIAPIFVWNQTERRAVEKKGRRSPQKGNETNGFEMLFDAMIFFPFFSFFKAETENMEFFNVPGFTP